LLRNKGRALAATAGGVLAITLIAGANISVDVAAHKILLITLDRFPIDIAILGQDQDALAGSVGRASRIDWVEAAEPVLAAHLMVLVDIDSKQEGHYRSVPILAVNSTFDKISERLGIVSESGFQLHSNEILLTPVSVQWLKSTGLSPTVGQNISLPLHNRSYEAGNQPAWDNITFTVKGICELSPGSWADSKLRNGFVLALSEALNLGWTYFDPYVMMDSFLQTPGFGKPSRWSITAVEPAIFVTLDRDQVFIPTDAETSLRNLRYVQEQLEFAVGGSGFIASPAEDAVNEYSDRLEQSRFTFLLASVPIIVLGVYLAMIGMDLSFAKRRAEIALLKCRGAGRRQITNLLFTECILLGIIAGILGLLLGSLITSMIILPVPAGHRLSLSLHDLGAIGISPPTAFICTMLGIGIMWAASITPIRKMNRASLIESTARYSPALAAKEYRKTFDIILVVLPMAVYLGATLARQGVRLAGPSLLQFILVILASVGLLMLPFSPFMLILGLTRLLTRGTTKTYEAISGLVRPVTGQLHTLVARNLSRNPARSSRVCVLIALSLAFGTFIMVYRASEQLQQEQLVIFRIGSDIRITTEPGIIDAQNLSTIQGVEEICEVLVAGSETQFQPTAIYALDPGTYQRCLSANRFLSRGLRKLLSGLGETADGALVFVSGRDTAKAGDVLHIRVKTVGEEAGRLSFRALGFFRYAPGIEETLYRGQGKAVIVTTSYVRDQVPDVRITQSRVYLKAVPGTNCTELTQRILDSNPLLDETMIQTMTGELTSLEQNPTNRALFSFMTLEFGFTLIMATFGLGLVMFAAATERQSEVAGQLARGTSKGQITMVLCGEAFSITALSFTVGVPVGAYTVFMLRTAMMGARTIPSPLTVPPILLVLFALVVVALMVTALLSALKISRMSLSQVLRVR